MSRKPRVFIAGPYISDPEHNTRRAIEIGDYCLKHGMCPYVPHAHTHWWNKQISRPEETWINLHLAFVPVCDALFRMQGASTGADREADLARSHGIPVFDKLDELTKWAETFSDSPSQQFIDEIGPCVSLGGTTTEANQDSLKFDKNMDSFDSLPGMIERGQVKAEFIHANPPYVAIVPATEAVQDCELSPLPNWKSLPKPDGRVVSVQIEGEPERVLLEKTCKPRIGDPRFLAELDSIEALHAKKQSDYGTGVDPFANLRASKEFGVAPWIGAVIRMHDKVTRIKSLLRNGRLHNESIVDSLRDIAVYALIIKVLYLEEHPKEATADSRC